MGLIKDSHVYSYSQLNSFDECPYNFYLQKIEKIPKQASNAFAERGTLIHDLLDLWAKGKLKIEDMPREYESRYASEVVTAFPAIMKDYPRKAYESGMEFLKNFDGFEGYKVISAEEKFTIDLSLTDGTTRKFTGIVDLILRKEWTNELIICDHKSKSMSSFKKAEDEMYKQQYLYSQYVYEKYGEWPKTLMFHLFGENGERPEREFSLSDYRETIQWATDCIQRMENYTIIDWLNCKESSDFYCQYLCSARNECPKSLEKPLTKKEKEELRLQREQEASLITETSVKRTVSGANSEEKPMCECGAEIVPGKRKCPQCKNWYKVRLK